jgi:hypothetical protein
LTLVSEIKDEVCL